MSPVFQTRFLARGFRVSLFSFDRTMGISGLLPLLRSATTSVNAVDIRGLWVAIDGYGWLHRGVHGCAAELGMGKVRRFVFVWLFFVLF